MTTRYFDEFPPYASADRQLLRITRVHRPTATLFPSLTHDGASSQLPESVEHGSATPSTASAGQLGSGTIMSVAMQGGGIDSISCYHPSVGVAECGPHATVHSRFHTHIPLFFPKETKKTERNTSHGHPSKWKLQSAFADSPFRVLFPTLGVRFRSDQANTYHNSEKDLSSVPALPAAEEEYVEEASLPSATPLMLGSTTFGELELEGWVGKGSINPSFSPRRERTPLQGSSQPSPSPSSPRGGKERDRKVLGVRVGPLGVRVEHSTELDPAWASSLSRSLLSGSENSASLSALHKQVTTSLETGFGFWVGKRHRHSTTAKKEMAVGENDGWCATTRGGYRVQCGLQYPLRGISDTLLSVTIESSLLRFFVIQTLASSYTQMQLNERSRSRSIDESSFSSPTFLQCAMMTAKGQLPTLGCVGINVIPNVLQLHFASMWQERQMEEFELSAGLRLSPFLRSLGETVVRIGSNTQRHLAVGITTSISKGIQITLGMHREGGASGQGIKFGLHLQC